MRFSSFFILCYSDLCCNYVFSIFLLQVSLHCISGEELIPGKDKEEYDIDVAIIDTWMRIINNLVVIAYTLHNKGNW